MKKPKRLKNYQNIFKLNWRVAWYGVVVWLLSIMLSGFVILPWFYVVFPIAIFTVTRFYFRRLPGNNSLSRSFRRAVFAQGLSVGFCWFFSILIFDFIQFVGLDFVGAGVYFLDPRNFIKYPIVILTPMIYGLIVENKLKARLRFNNDGWLTSGAMRLHP